MSQRICGLVLVGVLGLCATADARPLIEFTPEGVAELLYNDWHLAKAKCTAVRLEDQPRGKIRIGTFVFPTAVKGAPRLSFTKKDDKWEEVWEPADKPIAKAGDEVDAVWQRGQDLVAKPGDEVVLIYGREQWFIAGLSVAEYEVASKAPDSVDGGVSRLLYWFPYRKSEDVFFRAMASRGVASCAPNSLSRAADKISIAEIRDGFDQTPSWERHAYAIMLGFKGEPATDGLRFEESIKRSLAGDELVIDETASLMLGYLELEPDAGIKLLARELQKNPGRSDLRCATLQALRWSLQRKDSNLPPGERLRILHIMLDGPTLKDLVIRDLIRSKDWSQSSKLEELWERPGEDAYAVRMRTISYLLLAQKDGSSSESKQATDVLTRLRTKDAAAVQEIEAHARRTLGSFSASP